MSKQKQPTNLNEPPNVGKTLQRLRQALKLSLGDLSESSGVSKSIISQIERNESNPTLSTIWRLSNALDTDVEELIRMDSSFPGGKKILARQVPEIRSEDGLCRLKILNPPETVEWIQWYEFEAEERGVLESSPHQIGSVEHLYILRGEVEVKSGETLLRASAGEILRYRGDLEHYIQNVGSQKVCANMTLILRPFPKLRG